MKPIFLILVFICSPGAAMGEIANDQIGDTTAQGYQATDGNHIKFSELLIDNAVLKKAQNEFYAAEGFKTIEFIQAYSQTDYEAARTVSKSYYGEIRRILLGMTDEDFRKLALKYIVYNRSDDVVLAMRLLARKHKERHTELLAIYNEVFQKQNNAKKVNH